VTAVADREAAMPPMVFTDARGREFDVTLPRFAHCEPSPLVLTPRAAQSGPPNEDWSFVTGVAGIRITALLFTVADGNGTLLGAACRAPVVSSSGEGVRCTLLQRHVSLSVDATRAALRANMVPDASVDHYAFAIEVGVHSCYNVAAHSSSCKRARCCLFCVTERRCVCCAMRCGAVLCCAVLCCAVLCCAVLRCAVLCCAVLCCAVLCCAVLCYYSGCA
jgi:hypothetical protein